MTTLSTKTITLWTSYLGLGLLLSLFLLLPEAAFASWFRPIENLIYNVVVNLFGWAAMAGGWVLNIGINTFVVGFGDLFVSRGVGAVVDQLWGIVRDLFNLTFIFGLVFIGLRLIFDSNDSNAKSLLINIILAALLINFSLFFAKTVVEFTNVTAFQFAKVFPTIDGRFEVSGSFLNLMGLNTIFNLESLPEGAGFAYIFGSAALLSVMAFVFFAGGLLLIMRYVVLNLYIIMSPVMFLGWIFPGLSSESQKYWKGFLGQAFFAPVYLLMLYFAYRIMFGFTMDVGGVQQFASIFKTGATEAGMEAVLIPFVMIIGFLVLGLVVAQKIGAMGANKAVSIGSTAAKWAGVKLKNGATAAPRYIGQSAAYNTGNAISRNLQRLQQLEGTGGLSRMTRWAARTNLVNDSVGGAAKSMQQAKFGFKRTYEEDTKTRNQTDAAAERAIQQRRNAIPPLPLPLDPATATPAQILANQNAITAHQEARLRRQNQVRNMTNEELLEMARTNRAGVLGPEFASMLSDAQLQSLQQSGILDNATAEQLAQNRDDGVIQEITSVLNHQNASADNLTAAMEELNRLMTTASNERLQNMIRVDAAGNIIGPMANEAVASRLSNDQVTMLRQSGRATAAQMNQITDARSNGLTTISMYGSLADPGSPGGSDADFQGRQRRAMFRNAQEAGRLPVDVLAATSSREYLNPRIVEEFLNNNPADADIVRVRRNVQNHIASGTATAGWVNQWTNWSRRTPAGMRFGL